MFIDIRKEITKHEKMIHIIDAYRRREPEGFLKSQERDGRILYYHIKRNPLSGKWERKYIRKKDVGLAKRLAQKQYYSRVETIAEKNLKELEKFLGDYDEKGVDQVYESLSEARKVLIEPIKGSTEEMIRQWDMTLEKDTAPYQEKRIYDTDQGELVRSKSEIVIANALFERKKDLRYKYESQLVIEENERRIVLHPDFKVLNVHTGEVKYWEHIGMLDNPIYANDFVRKVNLYINNGYVIGRDVFFTFETSEHPLDTKTVQRVIEEIARC